MNRRVLERASAMQLACHPTIPLRTLDALHIATARSAPMRNTFDNGRPYARGLRTICDCTDASANRRYFNYNLTFHA